MRGYKFSYKVNKEPEFITRVLIRNKQDILEALHNAKERSLGYLKKSDDHSSAYCAIMESLYDNFIDNIKTMPIMTITDPWWHYKIEMNVEGLFLRIGRIDRFSLRIDDNRKVLLRETRSYGGYVVTHLSLRKLTVEEYAAKYGVEPVTVRQWIRRGKLRTAKKIGNEWRIPELTDIPKRGYEQGSYNLSLHYQTKRSEIDSPYEFLKEASTVNIFQDDDDKSKFIVLYDSNKDWESHTIEMDSKEREKFELYLISTPYFEYCGNDSAIRNYETKDGYSLFSYLHGNVSVEDLEKTGPGIEAENKSDLDMELDGFFMDDDNVYFKLG